MKQKICWKVYLKSELAKIKCYCLLTKYYKNLTSFMDIILYVLVRGMKSCSSRNMTHDLVVHPTCDINTTIDHLTRSPNVPTLWEQSTNGKAAISRGELGEYKLIRSREMK